MNKITTFKIFAIISYFLIILAGEMIGLPFFLWLIFTLFDFGNTEQFFALLAVLGLIIVFIKMGSVRTVKNISLDIICLLLLSTQLARRLLIVPLEKFNYLAFIIPVTIFLLFYFVSIYFSMKNISSFKKHQHDKRCWQHWSGNMGASE